MEIIPCKQKGKQRFKKQRKKERNLVMDVAHIGKVDSNVSDFIVDGGLIEAQGKYCFRHLFSLLCKALAN